MSWVYLPGVKNIYSCVLCGSLNCSNFWVCNRLSKVVVWYVAIRSFTNSKARLWADWVDVIFELYDMLSRDFLIRLTTWGRCSPSPREGLLCWHLQSSEQQLQTWPRRCGEWSLKNRKICSWLGWIGPIGTSVGCMHGYIREYFKPAWEEYCSRDCQSSSSTPDLVLSSSRLANFPLSLNVRIRRS